MGTEKTETEKVLETPELMEAIRQGKKDKKAGRGRPYEEFAKEAGLM